MPQNLLVGDTVFVHYRHIEPAFLERPKPFFKTEVSEVEGRSIRVTLANGEESDLIGSAVVHREVGILIVQIGDIYTEETLLNPLSKSILQFCRLLLGDDELVRFEKCRTITEFRHILEHLANAYQTIILVGHGSGDSLRFGMGNKASAETIKDAFDTFLNEEKSVISLCCETGIRDFAGIFSRSTRVESFIAPFHTVHGVVASQFLQTYLANYLLNGMTDKTAFNRAINGTATRTKFRFWEDGALST